ncbi:hypothetical protein C1645_822154 [Glomus cerebriforme]|uniref:Uncharacterized protein n=1 Tax=Glomus cerebriforme TaxID=658196 RepID=A0A397T0I8_9GLOM|nr:hypothetical protein C1645_822154 [Glomus cerebriforme]
MFQNPDTKALNDNYYEECGKKYTDIKYKKQLNINKYDEVIFEWIPYNQFKNIREISYDIEITLYSAMWENEDGSLNNWAKNNYKAGNILIEYDGKYPFISDMGLCGEVVI